MSLGRYGKRPHFYFSTKFGTSPPDFVAVKDDDTCDQSLAQAFNFSDLLELPPTNTVPYGPSCLAQPPRLPRVTNPCNVRMDSPAAASISAALTSTACVVARTGVICSTPSPKNAASKAQLPIGGAWALVMSTILRVSHDSR